MTYLEILARSMKEMIGNGCRVEITDATDEDPFVTISVDWPDGLHYRVKYKSNEFERKKERIVFISAKEAIEIKYRHDNPHSFQEWQARNTGRFDAGYENVNHFLTLECQCEKCNTQYLIGKKEFPPYKV